MREKIRKTIAVILIASRFLKTKWEMVAPCCQACLFIGSGGIVTSSITKKSSDWLPRSHDITTSAIQQQVKADMRRAVTHSDQSQDSFLFTRAVYEIKAELWLVAMGNNYILFFSDIFDKWGPIYDLCFLPSTWMLTHRAKSEAALLRHYYVSGDMYGWKWSYISMSIQA